KFRLMVDDNVGGIKSFFNFSNFDYDGSAIALLYDVTNGKKITTKNTLPNLRAVIPNGGARKICYLAAESQTINVTSLKPVGQSGNFTNFKDPLASKPFVIVYHKQTK